jgi:hypothetical protein
MYKLSLNNEELHTLRNILEDLKVRRKVYHFITWNEPCEAVLTKLVICQLDAEDEAEAEAKAERYAMNLHSRPEGA